MTLQEHLEHNSMHLEIQRLRMQNASLMTEKLMDERRAIEAEIEAAGKTAVGLKVVE